MEKKKMKEEGEEDRASVEPANERSLEDGNENKGEERSSGARGA